MKPKISLDPKAVPVSESKRKSRAKQFANMSEEQLKTFCEIIGVNPFWPKN